MKESDFSAKSPGKLVPTSLGVLGFVPNMLTPEFVPDKECVALLAEAQLALGELRGVGTVIPNPDLVAGPLMNREARYSSEIEGTIASAEELALAASDLSTRAASYDAQEVIGYRNALQSGLRRLESEPLNLDLLRMLHRHLLASRREQWKTPGEIRTIQNRIANRSRNERPEESRYIPPPPSEVGPLLEDLVAYINGPSEEPPVIRLAIVHYQFEAIHPFIDGNGRIGRLLIVLLLHQWKVLPQPLLQVSEYLSQNKSQYVELLLAVSQRGDWQAWIKFFLRAIVAQARDSVSRSKRLWELREEYRGKVQDARSSALLTRLVDDLFVSQVATASWVAAQLSVTYPTAAGYLQKLVDLGVVKPVNVPGLRSRNFYLADAIVEIGR